jgi:subtilase family serine protease
VTYAAAGTFTAWAQVDTGQAVPESSETNNVSGPRAVTVTAPAAADLLVAAIANPPVAATPGTRFAVTDTVRNQGLVTAGASTIRYYLSADGQKGAGDRLFTTKRAVASLAPGAASSKTMTLTIPTTTPPGTYVLLACADDLGAVVESDEQNNCRASAGTVTVGLPDLVPQTVSHPAGAVRRGTRLTVSDTVRNASPVATTRSAATRYYLSLDGVKSPNDVKLTGARTVPVLAAGATSSGSASVTVPSATAPGTYVVVACADDAGVVAEGNEANNCAAAVTPVTVTP